MLFAATFVCTVVSVYDGDGPIHCRERAETGKPIKIRLHGINAREMDGSCRQNAPCPKASAGAAKTTLTRLVRGKVLHCGRMGRSYGRIDARCSVDGVDVSCAMMRSGTVARWPDFDRDGRLLRCRSG